MSEEIYLLIDINVLCVCVFLKEHFYVEQLLMQLSKKKISPLASCKIDNETIAIMKRRQRVDLIIKNHSFKTLMPFSMLHFCFDVSTRAKAAAESNRFILLLVIREPTRVFFFTLKCDM